MAHLWSAEAVQGVVDSPLHRLIAAILRQALDDLKLGGRPGADALSWLRAGAPEQPWSFPWCCQVLGLEANAVGGAMLGQAVRGKPRYEIASPIA